MSHHQLFIIALIAQVLLISVVLPVRFYQKYRSFLDSLTGLNRDQQNLASDLFKRNLMLYRVLNAGNVFIGLGLVLWSARHPGSDLLNWDTNAVLTLYMMLQLSPFALLTFTCSPVAKLFMGTKNQSVRRAALIRRNLFEYVSPWLVLLAIATFAGFCVLIFYVQQFNYEWFGGYWNLVGIGGINLAFVGVIYHTLYGKRFSPTTSEAVKTRKRSSTVHTILLTSILATLFVSLSIVLRINEVPTLIPVAACIYFQLCALVAYSQTQLELALSTPQEGA